MAINKIQTNIIDRMADLALQQLRLMENYVNIVQMYGAEGVANLTDADITTLPELSHVTIAEFPTWNILSPTVESKCAFVFTLAVAPLFILIKME